MTYAELLAKLQTFTPEQLSSTVMLEVHSHDDNGFSTRYMGADAIVPFDDDDGTGVLSELMGYPQLCIRNAGYYDENGAPYGNIELWGLT